MVESNPTGVMSTYLREKAVPGTAVEFSGPAGSFYLREIRRPLLFLAVPMGVLVWSYWTTLAWVASPSFAITLSRRRTACPVAPTPKSKV